MVIAVPGCTRGDSSSNTPDLWRKFLARPQPADHSSALVKNNIDFADRPFGGKCWQRI
jgi:hypothetical protein